MAKLTTILTILLLCSVLFPNFAGSQNLYDVRQARWGMSPAEVMATEASKPIKKGPQDNYSNTLTYRGKLHGINANITYYFLEDGLVKVNYDFNNNHIEGSDYIDDYNKIKTIESREVGPPTLVETQWHNNLYEEHPQHHGTAISLGHMKRITHWDTPATNIKLILYGGNFEVRMSMVYKHSLTSKTSGEKNADIR